MVDWLFAPPLSGCRLCGATDRQRRVAPERLMGLGQWFHRCGHCGNGYLSPDMTDRELNRFYRDQYRRLFPAEAAHVYDETFFTSLAARPVAAQRARVILRDAPPGAAILEIGSGFGTLLAALHAADPASRLIAVEPDETHRQAGLQDAPVTFLPFEDALAAGPFDRIILLHTLEHLADPAELLHFVRDRLTPTGRVILEVPDAGAPWSGWGDVHPAHLSYFTGPGLDRLTARCGLARREDPHTPPGALFRVLIPAPPARPAPADEAEIAAFDRHIDRYRWRTRDSLRRTLKRAAIALLGVERVGTMLRGRHYAGARAAAATGPDGTRQVMMGAGLDSLSFSQALEEAIGAMQSRRTCRYADLNVAKFIEIRSDAPLRAAVESADRVLADGMGVVWGARALGIALPERITGIDLMQAVIARCAAGGFRPYFLGAAPDVLTEAVERLRQRHPDLIVAGQHHGYFTDAEVPEILAALRASRADCLIVAMGSPKQEMFLARHHGASGIPFAMMVGGSLDVIAGRFKRAPVWMQKAGLEWLARLLQDPARLARRYLVSNSLFLIHLGGAILARRLTRKSGP